MSQEPFSLLMSAYSIHYTKVELLQDKVSELESKNIQLENKNTKLESENAQLENENTRLKELLQLQQQRHFGKKSEVGEPMAPDAPTKAQVVSGYTRQQRKKSHGRLIDTSALLRHRIYHDLLESEMTCSTCQNSLHCIGQDVSEQVELLPLRLYCVEHIRSKYTCSTCKTLKMAPKPKAPIPKALAGESLLTEILINKYQYHLPLYRQSKILASYGAKIPDNTLGNWVMQVGEGLMPLYQALWETILASGYLQVDETPVKILEPEKKGYLWSYFAPLVAQGIVVFELSLTRSGEVAEKRLAGFKGLLQTDGYQGYNGLRKRKDISGLGCLTHGRRKFSDVLKITNNPSGIAAEAIERLKPVYALESRMREQKLCFHTRKRLRQKISWPILKEYHHWLKMTLPSVPPKSQLAKAIQYMLNQWPQLIAYLRHGKAEIDTNLVENKIRDIALGRKNWLFIGNAASGKIHALFYSLILSAIMNNLNPRVYIHYLITKIHDLRTGTVDPKTLLPHTIDHSQLQIFADQQIELSKKVLGSA